MHTVYCDVCSHLFRSTTEARTPKMLLVCQKNFWSLVTDDTDGYSLRSTSFQPSLPPRKPNKRCISSLYFENSKYSYRLRKGVPAFNFCFETKKKKRKLRRINFCMKRQIYIRCPTNKTPHFLQAVAYHINVAKSKRQICLKSVSSWKKKVTLRFHISWSSVIQPVEAVWKKLISVCLVSYPRCILHTRLIMLRQNLIFLDFNFSFYAATTTAFKDEVKMSKEKC